MVEKNANLILAWKEASKDLGIQIEIPFVIKTDNLSEIRFELLIKEFGGKNGTLIMTTDDMRGFEKAEKFGFYCSALNPFHYDIYNREHFVETLTDWGYYGQVENKPQWYDGPIYNND